MSAFVHHARVFSLPDGSWSWSYTDRNSGIDSVVEPMESFDTPEQALSDLRGFLPRPYRLQCEHDPDYIFIGRAIQGKTS